MRRAGASIYPMVQNIILACRALGLGTLITTNHMLYEDEVKAVLELPDDVQTYALMPIGYPRGNFGPLTHGVERGRSRRPLVEQLAREKKQLIVSGNFNAFHRCDLAWLRVKRRSRPVPNVVWLRSSIKGG